MHDRARSLVTSMLLLSACASVPPAHVDPARDPANPRASEATVVGGGILPTNDATLTVGKPPFETGESGTKEGSTGGHHHGGAAAPEDKPTAPMEHQGHDKPPPAPASKPLPHDHASQEMHEQEEETTYTCPMHPEVRSKSPGKCPKCGMTLVPEQKR